VAGEDGLISTRPGTVEEGEDEMGKTYVLRAIAGLVLLAMVMVGCGTVTGAAVGAGSGAAISAGTGGSAKRGALIGGGVGAAGGAIYDLTR